jgi:hypothetical protein
MKFSNHLFAFFLMTAVLGCSTDDTSLEDQTHSRTDIPTFDVNVKSGGTFDLLFDIHTEEGDVNKLAQFFSELDAEIGEDDKIKAVVVARNEGLDKLRIHQLELTRNGDLIQRIEYNGEGYNVVSNGFPGFIWVAAACPEGYSDYGTCGNFDEDRDDCLADKVSGHFSNSLFGPGDCAEVRVQVALLNSRVCGKSC